MLKPGSNLQSAHTYDPPAFPSPPARCLWVFDGSVRSTWNPEKPAAEQLLFHRLVGGGNLDRGSALAVNESNGGFTAWLGGLTLSTDLPVTPDAAQSEHLGGPADAFLAGLSIVLEDPPPTFVRGDVNADGDHNIADAVFTLGFLFGRRRQR